MVMSLHSFSSQPKTKCQPLISHVYYTEGEEKHQRQERRGGREGAIKPTSEIRINNPPSLFAWVTYHNPAPANNWDFLGILRNGVIFFSPIKKQPTDKNYGTITQLLPPLAAKGPTTGQIWDFCYFTPNLQLKESGGQSIFERNS